MGLLSRDKFDSPVTLRYTVSNMSKKRLIVGLGNPGQEYVRNRHNLGFMVVDSIAIENGAGWNHKKDLKSEICLTVLNNQEVILVKPQTFMNNSGEAVRVVMDFYKLTPEDITVVYDELDLPFGEIRVRQEGSSAGHNGIKSTIQHIGANFKRVRVGIGPKTPAEIDSADFVLQDFSKSEIKKLSEIITLAVKNL